MAKISMIVNGNPVYANVDPRTLLVQFLRENLRLTGTHVGCDTSQCCACVVHLDGKAVKSCTDARGDGRRPRGPGHRGAGRRRRAADPMLEAFREHHGLECGFCTPGMIMTAVPSFTAGATTSRSMSSARSSGNLCRCTGYENIVHRSRPAPRPWRIRSRVTSVLNHRDRERRNLHLRIRISSSGHRAAGRQSARQEPRRRADRRRPHAGAADEAAACEPPHLVDLSHVQGLDAIEMRGRGW